MRALQHIIEDLQEVDFGHAEVASPLRQEVYLQNLERLIDELEQDHDLWFPEADQIIRYFSTNMPRSRMYMYGPTDIGDGRGLLEKLKRLDK